jgi:IS4 transposase
MGNNIPDNRTVEKCLEILDLKNYRHPYVDHGSKKLLTGSTIMLLVEAELQKHESLSDIEENLCSKPAIQSLTGLKSIHASTIYRKIERLPFHLLEELREKIFKQIDDFHSKNHPVTSDIGKLSLLDSSQISLPKKADWAYVSKDKNSIKIHTRLAVLDENTTYPNKVIFSTGAVDDKEVALEMVTEKDTTHVMDRGYINYHHFHLWRMNGILFVARVKANSKLRIIKERTIEKNSAITLDADVEIKDPETEEFFNLRLVEYKDDQNRPYRVVTNRFDLSPEEVAEIYKRRWLIELFFKWMKQNLQTIKLYSHKPQAVWNQICISFIAYGLVELIKIQTGTTKTNKEVLRKLRHYWHREWDDFLESLHRPPSRHSKGRRKKGKPGRPRKYPKKMKAVKLIIN